MIVRGSTLYTVLLFILIALQQSCGTNTIVRPSVPIPAEPAAQSDAAVAVADAAPQTLPAEAPTSQPATASAPKELLPESVIAAPDKETASATTKYDTRVFSRALGAPPELAWEYRQNPQGQIVGFDLSNRGGNRILPDRYNIDRNLFFTRDFQFRFDDRARQDIHLAVTDWAPSRDRQFRLSELMNSVLHFFPRKYVPAIATSNGRSVVTLPTGEQVEFDAKTHEVLSGVLAEAPVDLNIDKSARRFAAIDYVGKGLVVRVDARGTDPRLGTTATITARPSTGCDGQGCEKICRVPSRELWNQKGAVRFKFATDEEFDRYLLSRCGFAIPQTPPFAVVALQ